jgi:hypothetical protein
MLETKKWVFFFSQTAQKEPTSFHFLSNDFLPLVTRTLFFLFFGDIITNGQWLTIHAMVQ